MVIYRAIGNEKWYKKGGERSMFAQQPVDALGYGINVSPGFSFNKR